jgi:hypothetical protein
MTAMPPFSFANRFAVDEAAQLVLERVQTVLARREHAGLAVKQVRLDDELYVIVWGTAPDMALRQELADVFSIGTRAKLPDDRLEQVFGVTVTAQ